MKNLFWALALGVAVVVSGGVLLGETPARADSCYGSCTMSVPGGTTFNCRWECGSASCAYICTPTSGYVNVSTNCVVMGAPNTGAPCACPYEGNGPVVSNGCPDRKP